MRKYFCTVPLVFVLCLVFACQDKAAMAELEKYKAQAELEARNIGVVKTIIAELDKGNAEIILKLYAPDSKFYFPSNSPNPMSREDIVAMVKMINAAEPDFTHNIVDIFAAKDYVIARLTSSGTHQAEFEGIPATGIKATVSALDIYRLKDGLVVEEFEEADMLGFYKQLGMELKPIQEKKK